MFLYFQIVSYLVSSVVSLLLAVGLLVCYSVSISLIDTKEGECKALAKDHGADDYVQRYYGKISRKKQCEVRVKFAVILIMCSVFELLAAAWSIACCWCLFDKRAKRCQFDVDQVHNYAYIVC